MKDLRIELIKQDEGFRSSAYRDSEGYLTIGYGFCIDGNKGCGLSVDECEHILKGKVNDLISKIGKTLGPWTLFIGEARHAVLLNVAYNVGFNGLLKFEKMLKALKDKDYQKAHDELLDSDAARKLPKRYGRLAKMLLTDQWPEDGKQG